MDSCVITNARVYVSTRKMYAGGNRFGIWVELSGFGSRNAYLEHCRTLFKEEQIPEVVHLDWQDIPVCLINENRISAKVFRLIEQVKGMEETQQKGFALWLTRQPDGIYAQKAKEIVQSFTGFLLH